MNESIFGYLFADNMDIHIIRHRRKHTNNPLLEYIFLKEMHCAEIKEI